MEQNNDAMTLETAFTTIVRQLKQRDPVVAWAGILRFASGFPDVDEKEVLLDAINRELEDWDDLVREKTSQQAIVLPVYRIIRHLNYYRESSAHLEWLAKTPQYSELTCLTIQRCEEVDGVEGLLNSPYLGKLRYLSIYNSGIGDEDLNRICASDLLKQLETLRIVDQYGTRYLEILLSRKDLKLRKLDISRSGFGKEHLQLLVGAGWRDLEVLGLGHTSIGDEAIPLLTQAAFMEKLREADFSETRVSREGAALLRSKSPFGDQLKIKINRYEEV